MAEDGSELFLTHYVGGVWRAPFGTALIESADPCHPLVAAGPDDVARVRAAAQADAPIWAALGPAARRAALPDDWADLVGTEAAGSKGGQLWLLPWAGAQSTAAQTAAAQTIATLARLLVAGDLVVLMPDPADPMPAYRLMQTLHAAGLQGRAPPAGVLSLLAATDPAEVAAALGARLATGG